MKACVLRENDRLEVCDYPLLRPAGWYLVKVACAGVCGSDIGRAFRHGAYHYPLVMGHEFSGVIADAPAGGAFPPGARVAVYPLLPCGVCDMCRQGHIQLCAHYDYFGSRRDGGFAEFVAVPEANLLPVPAGVTLEEAALTEPAAVARHAVYSAPVEPGTGALVIGGGPIGILAAQWLRIRDCGEITVSDVDPKKLEFARTLGFQAIAAEELKQAANRRFDLCVEACGLSETRSEAIRHCAGRGHVFLIGNPANTWELEREVFSRILREELTLSGGWNSLPKPDWSETLRHAGRTLHLRELVTDRVALDGAPELLKRIFDAREFHCKSLIVNP